jgi:hypothetical protein
MADSSEKHWALTEAISITKEAAKGGATKPLDTVLEEAYKKIVLLYDDTKK